MGQLYDTVYRLVDYFPISVDNLKFDFISAYPESPALGFYVHVEETSVTIDNIVDRHLNDSCPYTWYNVQFISSKQMIFDNYTNYPKTFTELEPYTDYKVTIKSHKSPILNKIVKTLEGGNMTLSQFFNHSSVS